jgi:DNA replication protein DnaC
LTISPSCKPICFLVWASGVAAIEAVIAEERERWATWERCKHRRHATWQPKEARPSPPVDLAHPQVAPNYACQTCHDAGIVKVALPSGRYGLAPWRYDLVVCSCRAQQVAERRATRIKDASNLTAEMQSMTFASYQRDWDPDAFDAAWAFAEGLADGGTPEAPFLLLFGTYGSGKTHLMAAIAHHAMHHSRQPLFAVVPSLLDWFKAAFGQPAKDREQQDAFEARFRGICDADVLLLDDLGAENSTGWAQEKLFQIINHRYARRLPTVFSTNLTPDKMEPRVADRLMDLAVCEQVGTVNKSYRQHAARAKQRRQKGAA